MTEIPKRKIGLIVPCYNVERVMTPCLDSIAAQTYTDFACVLVNDGSTDGTQGIISEYCRRFPEIFYSTKRKNGGLSAARNTGLALLEGKCEYVTFADSDDYLSADYLSSLAASAEKYQSDIVWGFHSLFKETDGKKEIIELPDGYRSHPMLQSSPVTDMRAFTEEILRDRIQSYSWGKLYRMRLFDGLRFPEGRIYEDVATTYLLAWSAGTVSAIEPVHTIYYYRVNPQGIVSTKTLSHSWHIYLSNCEQYAFCKKNGLACTEHIRAVRLSNALATVHCRMRGNAVPEEVFQQAAKDIKALRFGEIHRLETEKKRKVLLLFARFSLKLYMKLMKKFVSI